MYQYDVNNISDFAVATYSVVFCTLSSSLLRDAVRQVTTLKNGIHSFVRVLPSNTFDCDVLDPILNISVQGIQSVQGVDMQCILEAAEFTERLKKQAGCHTKSSEFKI